VSARTNTGAGPARAAAPGPSTTRPPASRRLGLALTVIATAQLATVTVIRVRRSDLDGTPQPVRR
jgi:hypothetical protein